MFNKLKVYALDLVVEKLCELLRDYNATVRAKEYLKEDCKHEKAVMRGLQTAVDVAYDVRKQFIKR